MVNYPKPLITSLLRMHLSTNIKTGMLLCKNIIYQEWKHLWVGFLSSILAKKFGLIFLKIWKLSRHIHLENNMKTPCHRAKIPLNFRSYTCHFSIKILFWCSSFPLRVLPLQLLSHPPCSVHRHAFLPLFFCFCFCLDYLFYMTLIGCILGCPVKGGAP